MGLRLSCLPNYYGDLSRLLLFWEKTVLRITQYLAEVKSPRMREQRETFSLSSSKAASSQMKCGVGGQATRSLNSK